LKLSGNILKMRTEIDFPVSYYLSVGETEILMNEYIGRNVEINFTGQINCVRCGRKISKSFAQGYCFPCFQKAPETEECVLRPELCKAHEGIARDMDYAKEHCLRDHIVYLSYTSNIKVGVTRNTQIPTRWIDQGAISAIKLAKTPNRYTAGLIEVALKKYFADRTNWRNMLKDNVINVDLLNEKFKAIIYFPESLKQFIIPDNNCITIKYPIEREPEKITSINLDKEAYISDILIGIKGQYLIFNSEKVLNIRNFAGYYIELNV
jgi:hypothetical protein